MTNIKTLFFQNVNSLNYTLLTLLYLLAVKSTRVNVVSTLTLLIRALRQARHFNQFRSGVSDFVAYVHHYLSTCHEFLCLNNSEKIAE